MARTDIPKITWGTSFANTLNLGYPIDNVITWSQSREGSQFVMTPAGVLDAWSLGHNYYLQGDVRWIPGSAGTTPSGDSISGWDGSTGFRAFLEWAREGNAFRWFPDKGSGTYVTAYLDPNQDISPALERDQNFRRFRLTIWNASSEFAGY